MWVRSSQHKHTQKDDDMTTETKQKVRIAFFQCWGIKNRCRKEDFLSLHGVGETTEEAILDLKSKYEKESTNWKTLGRKAKAYVYDGERDITPWGSSLGHELYMGQNMSHLDFEEISLNMFPSRGL